MACTEYGSGPNGFIRKPFTAILNDLWAGAQANDPNLIRDDTCPQGQIISLYADATNDLWMELQGLSDNCDITKAEGCQLDKLATLTGTTRRDGETDAEFRQRILGGQQINNELGNTVLDTLITCLYGLAGVTCVDVNVNETGNFTAEGLPPHSYEVVVQGGDDQQIADTIWKKHPVGITLFGNTSVDVETQLNCQTVSFSRPVEVPICMDVTLKAVTTDCGCTESDIQVIKDTLLAFYDQPCPSCENGVGDDFIYGQAYVPFYTLFNGFTVTSLQINGGMTDIPIGNDEIAVLDCDCLNITFE